LSPRYNCTIIALVPVNGSWRDRVWQVILSAAKNLASAASELIPSPTTLRRILPHRVAEAELSVLARSKGGAVAVLSVRPKVAELVFQLYGRPLHPELFEIYHSRTVKRGGYEAKIDITSAGHVVTWRHGGMTLTEVAASAQHPLPEKRRLLSYSLKGQREDHIECRGGVRYAVNFQLEPVEPEVFWTFQHELAEDGLRQGMLHKFQSSGRMALGALSYIHIECRTQKLLVQAFHTFPDDYAIVKSQSLFQLP
jgi:hypothetical protein